MKKPLVSIIVPAYNEEKNIGACVRSLIKQQTSASYEVIVVDNNSTDRTGQIAASLGARVVIQKRQGRAYARQKGADRARGNILAYTEADCVAPIDWIENMVRFLTDHPQFIGIAGGYTFTESTPFLRVIGPKTVTFSSFLYRWFTGNNTLRATNFAIRKATLQRVKGFNPRAVPFDDLDLGFRAGKLGPIHHDPHLRVATSDRRVRGRLLVFCKEFCLSFTKIFILKQRGHDNLYAVVRSS